MRKGTLFRYLVITLVFLGGSDMHPVSAGARCLESAWDCWAKVAPGDPADDEHPFGWLFPEGKKTVFLRDELAEAFPGIFEPLVDYQSADIAPAQCISGRTPSTYAILIGASEAGEPLPDLPGAANDVDLLSASFEARDVDPGDMYRLLGNAATRRGVATAFEKVAAASTCGDRIYLHFGGHSGIPEAVVSGFLPQVATEKLDGFALTDVPSIERIAAYQRWADTSDNAPPGEEGRAVLMGEAALDLEKLKDTGILLVLNENGGTQVFSPHDLSDFMTTLRNRGADVTVTLDTSRATLSRLAERQFSPETVQLWKVDVGTEEEEKTPWAPLPLGSDPGDFAVLYSSIGDSEAREIGVDDGSGGKKNYGVFTFKLAAAIQNRVSVTIRALAEALKQQPEVEGQIQAARVVASDPEMTIFAGDAPAPQALDTIVITRPAPTRGAAKVDRPEVEIAGVVEWSAPVRAVLIDGHVANLEGRHGFSLRVPLTAGLNTLDIIALTGDGRTHQRTLEFLFEGDRQALQGEGKRYAVVVANQSYGGKTGYAPLSTPFADADAIENVLVSHYGFVTEAVLAGGQRLGLSLRDATGRDIQSVLHQLGSVAGENDTVLIYYAGHGEYEEATTNAYWIPADAEYRVPFTYLSAAAIADPITRMQAGNVILISDSCFSGALMRGGPGVEEEIADADRIEALLRKSKRRSRILISSGNNEPVSDIGGAGHSVFAAALLNGLENMEYDAFSALELFNGYILDAVSANADQEPQYRPIERVGHDGGDVVFVRVPRG